MNWSIIIQIISIGVVLYAATRLATKQNERILTQNLEIKTYEALWLAIQSLNSSIVEFQVACGGLPFLEDKINREPLIGETQADANFRNRNSINEYLSEFEAKANEIRNKWGEFHQLWEQKEPIIYGLSTAFAAYRTEFEKVSNRLMFPTVNPWLLDITNFSSMKSQLEGQNSKTVEMIVDLLVYGIDMSRMIQKQLLSKYYDHKPEERGMFAQSGYQLTEQGLTPVASKKFDNTTDVS